MMRENRGRFISMMSLAGLLLLTSVAFAQKKPASPVAGAKTAASAEQLAPAVVDGRTVKVESGARLSPESIAKVQAAFNRRLPRDLRTYTLGEVISAAEAAAAEGSSTAKLRVCVKITCCPWTITITWPCSGAE